MNEYESKQSQEIEKWKKEEPSVISNITGVLMKPVTWLVEAVVPQKAIEGALQASDHLAEALTDKDDIVRDGNVSSIEELQTKDLKLSDNLANTVHNWAVGIAGAEGAAAGAAGLAGLIVDIPTLITMSLRVIHKIALCYGFEVKTKEDHDRVFAIMSAAGSNTAAEKTAAVAVLTHLNVMIAKSTWKSLAQKAAANKYGKEAAILGIKQLAKQLGINITKRKAAQAVPVIGAGVGAAMNIAFINDIAWAARRIYQEKWLITNGHIESKE